MKELRFLVSGFAMVLLLAACGAKPLTDEQKARLAETMTDIQKTGDTVNSKARGARPAAGGNAMAIAQSVLADQPALQKLPSSIKKLFGGFMGMQTGPTGMVETKMSTTLPKEWKEYRAKRNTEREAKMKAMGEKLVGRFLDGSCTIPETDLNAAVKNAGNAADAAKAVQNVKFRIVGDKCPILAEFHASDVKGSADGKNSSGKFGFSYEVKDKDLIAVSEVLRVKMDFEMDISSGENSADVKAGLKGSTTTVAEGDIEYKVDLKVKTDFGNPQAPVFEMTSNTEMKFKDFKVEVEMEFGANQAKLTVNGEEATSEELIALFQGNDLQAPGEGQAAAPGAGSPPPGQPVPVPPAG